MVPTRVYPKSGRISALAGRQGRLRACTENFQRED
ncbi:replication protein RepA4 [Escherichia coli]|nr:replication protein RepA4 [Escherichia coli]